MQPPFGVEPSIPPEVGTPNAPARLAGRASADRLVPRWAPPRPLTEPRSGPDMWVCGGNLTEYLR